MTSKLRKRNRWTQMYVLFVLLILGTITAHSFGFEILNGITERLGISNARPTPTPQTKNLNPKKRRSRPVSGQNTQQNRTENLFEQPLAVTDFNLIGLVATVNPATQTVPKNIPTGVITSIQVPDDVDPATIIPNLNPNYRIRGELVGPSFTAPQTVEAKIGEPISIPPLPNVGDHVVQNLRVVDITDATGATLAPVMPDSVGITVIERVLVTQVQVNEMTYEQIVQSGINIDNNSYNFYNFVLGLATTSGTVPITIPVAMPSVGGAPPVVGQPQGGVGVNGVAIPDVVPILLEADPDGDGDSTPIEMPGGGQLQIPGVVVFPGRIGLLHQFFEAIVIVANGAPNGTPLVITNLRANAKLPDNGTADESDDPLRIALTQQGGRVSQLDIHGLGADGRYGTSDDTTSFSPGQSGQATFLLEGLREGLHTVDFKLTGTLQGLPIGPVNIVGNVPGAVLVRDARFGVTFTHPSIVRAGQTYELGVTLFNSGDRNINGVQIGLARDSVSGATLIDDEFKMITQTIPRGGSATVKWKLRSNITGAVTASYVKVGDGVEAGLSLVTGVGDRNVPLSPDSLILPDPVRHLPQDVVEAGRQMLGQAWSVANAPAGTLPNNVLPIDKQTVISKAVELGWAGLRVDFKEDRDTTLRTLLRDWLGENQTNSSSGFADALRNTPAGYYFFDVVGNKFYETVGAESPADFHKKLVTAEAARSSFVSALVTQNNGSKIFGAKLNSPTGQGVGFGANADERFGDLKTGASLELLETDPHDAVNSSKGNLLVVSKPVAGNWSLELFGRADGNADVSILAPTSGKNYRQMLFPNVAFTNGKRYRITFKASGTTAPVVEEFVNGSYQAATLTFTSSDVAEPNPQVVGVAQVTQDVIEGGDKFGRLVGVLFSKPMVKSSVEAISRYQIGGGELVSDPTQVIGRLIKPTGSSQNFGGRFAIVAMDSPIGPYIKRNLTVNGAVDTSGKSVLGSVKDIEPRVSPFGVPPGGYMTGRVMNADGTPVTNAQVYYRTDKINHRNGETCGVEAEFVTIANRKTDSNGEFQFDYVREGECFPVNLLAVNIASNSTKSLMTNVAYDGQHLTLNAVFLARGNVQGTVKNGNIPLVNATVSIIPELDILNSKLVKTDAQGKYSATGVPVGGITVRAVGDGVYSLASGIASGNINEAGQTITVNVPTQDLGGGVKGKVLDSGSTGNSPVPNSLVVAYADIPGFPRSDGGLTPVGYAFTKQDGTFDIQNLPIGNISLRATDPQRGVTTSITVQLTPENKQVEGIIMLVSNGFGRVLGRVLNEIGQPIANAVVSEGSQQVRADANGNYILPGIREGNVSVTATDPVTRQVGQTTVSVRRGEDTNGADIIIRRPANLNGQVFISENGVTQPLAQVYVTVDGRTVAQTDSQGRYALNSIPSGSTTIRYVYVQRRQFVNTDVFLNPGETLTRNATFKPAKIHGRITQPDGVTPVIATVSLVSLIPDLTAGPPFGFPKGDNVLTVQTNTNGQYSFDNLNPGPYRVSTSNVFFPIPVSQSGNIPPNGNLEINLSLVDTLAGKIHGHIYQPDGVTPVGAGVKVSLGGGTLADVTVRTNAEGYYEFAEVFAEGSYILTATDPQTSRTNQTAANVRKNEEITVDLRLLGRGTLKVRAVDGGNNPLPNGVIRVEAGNYPREQRVIELNPANNGVFEFTGLSEGSYAISALYNGLGGRVSANVTSDGVTEVTVQVQAVGSITGRVLMPDGATPVGLADVTLMQSGRIIGFITTSDSEEDRGKFTFLGVPSGDFTIDGFDNRSGRRGRSAGQIIQQGQAANVDVRLLALGTVVGQVTSNGVPAQHALVNVSADGSGIASTSRVATTDDEGKFRFTGIPVGRVTVSVTNGPGGLTGQASGMVFGTIEPLPETVINVALTPTATIGGTIYKFGGTETYTGALVNIRSGNYVVNTVSDENGKYRASFIPLGNIEVRVESPFGYDRGKSATILSNQPGATVLANVTMSGVGSINGLALDSNGSPLAFGKVEFTNNAWNENISVVVPVQPDGHFSLSGLPTGDFNLKLTVSDRIGVGTATGNLTGNQTLSVNLQLESAGKIYGVLKSTDGTSPAIGADVNLFLARQNGGFYQFVTHTNSEGRWEYNNLPLGTITVSFSDPNTGGIARLTGLALTTNGQELDAGTAVLDNTPIAVESVSPPNETVNVATNSAVQVVFSEPVDTTTVNGGTVRIMRGSSGVSASQTISPDEKTITLTPTSRLAELSVHTIVVTTQVRDKNGNYLTHEFTSAFTTKDETAPTVTAVSPAAGSVEIPLNSHVFVTASEALDASQNFAEAVQVKDGQTNVAGNYTLDQTGRIIDFAPSANLTESTGYAVTVNGLRDLAGNVQTQAFSSGFTTKDLTAPTVDPLPINGQTVRTFMPAITATYHDNASGIKTNTVVLNLDGTNVTPGATVTGSNLSYTPASPLSAGNHTVTVQVSDNAGNTSAIQSATFTIDNSGPIISSFTIGGIPVANGVQISTSLNPIFEINYTDDTGINTAASKLKLGLQGSTPVEVPATITNTKLTYQSPTPMTEGVYTVQAILTNNLGTSTDTGVITFTLDVDAPEIQTITPNSGNQHGGTTVVLSGLRLLNTNNSAPSVKVGGAQATVTSAVVGDNVTIITPAGVPGGATIELTTDRGIGRAINGFNYQADPRTPFAVEPDTKFLWRLDETGNGGVNVLDSGQLGINGSTSGNTIAAPGRFVGGRSATSNGQSIQTINPAGALNFGSTGLTLDFWLKTSQGSTQRPIVQFYNDYYGELGILNLETTGAITARFWAMNSAQWNFTMPASAFDVDDNQWHSVSLVFAVTENKFKIYIDGELRTESTKPANFDALRENAGYPNRMFAFVNQNYTIDEVRASLTAHSASQILNTYLGTEGNLQTVIFPPNSSIIFPRGTANDLSITGYNLAGVSASAADSAGNPVQVQVVNSSAGVANLKVTVANEAALGNAQITLSSSTNAVTIPFRIIDLTRTVPGADLDTIFLWHLDETENGGVTVADAGVLGITGSTSGNTIAAPGRFANGRSSSSGAGSIQTQNTYGAMNFGSSGYTVETWFKTPQGNTQRQVLQLYNDYYGELGVVNLESTGAMTARLWAFNGAQWNLTVPPTAYDIDNNQWHHLAWVLDETDHKQKIYIDGELRGEASKPANFDAIRENLGYPNRLYMFVYQNWTVDEIRVSSTPHSAQTIQQDFLGESNMRVSSYSYPEIVRNHSTVSEQEFTINGYNLENINAQVVKNGQPINVGVSLTSSSFRQAKLNLAVQPDTPLGLAQLVITKPNQPTATINLQILEKNPLVADTDTIFLWHLDETENGGIFVADSGLLGLHGNTSGNTTAVPGRFGNGRSSVSGAGSMQTINSYGALNFGGGSFTTETWIKTPQSNSQKILFQMYNDYYGEVGSMYLEGSGILTAKMFSMNNTQWFAATTRTFNSQSGYSQGRIDDNNWHHVALVIDRTENKMKIYVDGEVRAETAKPASFDNLRENTGYPNRFYAFVHQNFIQDDIRVSGSALTADRVAQSYYGLDQFRLYRTYPLILQRDTTTPVFISGYGLDAVTVSTNRSDVTATISSATLSQIVVAVTPNTTAQLGDVQLILTKSSGESLSTHLSVVDQRASFPGLDTVLLWHLDETENGGITIADAGALGLHGSTSGNTTAVPGRFGNGRSSASGAGSMQTINPYGALNFGGGSFTFDTWVKAPESNSQRILFQMYNDYYGEVGSMYLEGSGAISGKMFSMNNTQWFAATTRTYNPQTGFWQGRVDDNYWHHLALVIDRTENKMKIYVDGELRAETIKPPSFDNLRENTGYPNRFYAFVHQNFIQDEIRVSSTAFSDERISESYFGFDQFRLYRTYPAIAQRGTATPISITGYGLNDVTVMPNRPDVAINVVSATLSQLDLIIEPTATADVGDVQITLMKPSGESLNTKVTVVNQQPFANNETGTILMWHLNETLNGGVSIFDSGQYSLHGSSSGNTTAVPGRFANGRSSASGAGSMQTVNSFGLLNFGGGSLTFEGWLKTNQSGSQRQIMQMYNDYYGEVGSMYLEGSGVLSARLFSLNNTQWFVATSRSYNPQTGFWQGKIDDNYWHHFALVLDRTENKLKIYVDGELQAETAKPVNFDNLRENTGYPNRFYLFVHQNYVQDEIRILNYPRSTTQIHDTWLGSNSQPFAKKTQVNSLPEKAVSGLKQEKPPDKPNDKKADDSKRIMSNTRQTLEESLRRDERR